MVSCDATQPAPEPLPEDVEVADLFAEDTKWADNTKPTAASTTTAAPNDSHRSRWRWRASGDVPRVGVNRAEGPPLGGPPE
jgi:hypothetical protein